VRHTRTYSVETLSPLEILASIICESGGARFLGLQRAIPGHPALILFCEANAPLEGQTPCALPIFEVNTHSVRERLALEKARGEGRGGAR
jgi:hypothetical protein